MPDDRPALLPLAARNVPPGAETIEVNGYTVAMEIDGFELEYTAVREAAALYDFSMLHKYDIRGAGALDAVDAMVVRDLAQVPAGRAAYGPLIGDDGYMIDDPVCMRVAEDHIRISGGAGLPGAIEDLAAPGVTVEPLRDQLIQLNVQGPRSRELLAPLANGSLANEDLFYYGVIPEIEIAGVSCFVARLGYSGELSFELWAPAARALELWDGLVEAGASFGVRGAGAAVILTARSEAGMIIGEGLDYGPATSPWECALGWTVSRDKRGYRGCEALLAARETAPDRLVTVRLDAPADDDATGAPIWLDDQEIGHLNLAVSSPHEGTTIALSTVRKEHAEPDQKVTVRHGNAELSARIVETPVYDPERRNVRG